MNKVDLLRHIVANLHTEPLIPGPIGDHDLARSPFSRSRLTPDGHVGVRKQGDEALATLGNELFQGNPAWHRGCELSELATELFDVLIKTFHRRKPEDISAQDVSFIEESSTAMKADMKSTS